MYVKTEVEGFGWLLDHCWSGAVDTLNVIYEKDKEEDFMDYLEEMFFESSYEIPTMTELNDFLWFDDQTIFEDLGIEEIEEEEDDWDDKKDEDEEE